MFAGWALQKVLTAMVDYSGGRDKADDQLAATQLVNGNIALPSKVRIMHDTHQELFGSFVHVVRYKKTEHIYRKGWYELRPKKFTCTDGKGNLIVRGCIDVGIKENSHNSLLLNDGVQYKVNANCNVERLNSMLDNVPIFWHGNGPGRTNFNKMQTKRLWCLARQQSIF